MEDPNNDKNKKQPGLAKKYKNVFFGLNQSVLIIGSPCENSKEFLCVVFEKIKFKILKFEILLK